MTTRNELFLSAVDVLHSGRSLDVEGEHGSGRTHFLTRIGDYFTSLGWRTIVVHGLPAFSKTPLIALSVAGLTDGHARGAEGIAASVASLTASVVPGRTLLVADDWDALDEYSSGVLRTVQARAAIPILSSRLVHRGRRDPTLPTGAFTTTYAMRLPGMGYTELESALHTLVDFRVEPGTLSRVFAKSGGNVGLAAAVVDAAQRADALVVEDGVARATGSLWTPALRHLGDVLLQPLPRASVEALEVLALLGPVGMSTAVRAVGAKRVSDLERRSFLTAVDIGGDRVVSIRPPLLVEHLRHAALAGRRSELLARIDDILGGDALAAAETSSPRDAAVFLRLVHEASRRRTLRSREAWRSSRSLAAATALLAALETEGAHDADEVAALVAAAHALPGSERERADWAMHRWALAAMQGDPATAVAELRAAAGAVGRESGFLLGRAAELEATFLRVADLDALASVETASMSAGARAAVLRARAFWMLARGLGDEAEEALAQRAALGIEDPLADALVVIVHVTAERFDIAGRLAGAGLAAAQKALDPSLIRTYAFLAALTASMDRRPDDADRILSESAFLALASPVPTLSFVGLTTMAAEMAARRGQRGLMEQLLADVDAAGLTDGPLAGQSSGMSYARMAYVEGGADAAATACLDAGDALWGRGALFSAACCYLEAVQYTPRSAVWDRVAPRVERVRMPVVARQASVVRALAHADAEALERRIDELEVAGRPREALHVADLALTTCAAADAASFATLRDRLRDGLGPAASGNPGIPSVDLTRREREVAELVASGLTNAVIAEALVLSVRTVESHVNRLLRKTGLAGRQDVKGFLLAQDARV